jgi:hypothetical protein
MERHKAFKVRRDELRATLGSSIYHPNPDRTARLERQINARLVEEGYGDLLKVEERAALERRRAEITSLLGYDSPEELSEDERGQLEERVSQQLAEEFPDAKLRAAG